MKWDGGLLTSGRGTRQPAFNESHNDEDEDYDYDDESCAYFCDIEDTPTMPK